MIVVCFAGQETRVIKTYDQYLSKSTVKTYGKAVVTEVTTVEHGYVFHCNIKDWPAVIGENIPVKIDGIEPPLIVARQGKPNEFYELHAKKFIETSLKNAKQITLQNIKRGRSFSLLADVIIDSDNLADLMIKAELAQRLIPPKEPLSAIKYDIAISAPRVPAENKKTTGPEKPVAYIASKNGKVFHSSTCGTAKSIAEKNTVRFSNRETALRSSRRPCKICDP